MDPPYYLRLLCKIKAQSSSIPFITPNLHLWKCLSCFQMYLWIQNRRTASLQIGSAYMNVVVLINAQICIIITLESLKEKGIHSPIKNTTSSLQKVFDLLYATRPETDFSSCQDITSQLSNTSLLQRNHIKSNRWHVARHIMIYIRPCSQGNNHIIRSLFNYLEFTKLTR